MEKENSIIENEWIPPHRISKGYPWNTIASKEFSDAISSFKFKKIEGEEAYGFFIDNARMDSKNNQNICESGYILQEALAIAEEQIADMLLERPFIPEAFGFEVIVKPKSTSDFPVTIYQSKFDENVIIFRNNRTDSGWTVQQKQPEGTTPPIKESEFDFPCERIAVAVFYAMGIKFTEN